MPTMGTVNRTRRLSHSYHSHACSRFCTVPTISPPARKQQRHFYGQRPIESDCAVHTCARELTRGRPRGHARTSFYLSASSFILGRDQSPVLLFLLNAYTLGDSIHKALMAMYDTSLLHLLSIPLIWFYIKQTVQKYIINVLLLSKQ